MHESSILITFNVFFSIVFILFQIKQKVVDIDKQFVEINKNPTPKKYSKSEVKMPEKKKEKNVTKEEVANAAEKIVKMDL